MRLSPGDRNRLEAVLAEVDAIVREARQAPPETWAFRPVTVPRKRLVKEQAT